MDLLHQKRPHDVHEGLLFDLSYLEMGDLEVQEEILVAQVVKIGHL